MNLKQFELAKDIYEKINELNESLCKDLINREEHIIIHPLYLGKDFFKYLKNEVIKELSKKYMDTLSKFEELELSYDDFYSVIKLKNELDYLKDSIKYVNESNEIYFFKKNDHKLFRKIRILCVEQYEKELKRLEQEFEDLKQYDF